MVSAFSARGCDMGPGLQEGPTSKIWEQCSYPGQDSYTIMGANGGYSMIQHVNWGRVH